jgi:hypothetical protein
MTKAEILTATRALVNEVSGDAGALLSDTVNLLEYINDSMEHVVLDLLEFMPEEFLASQTVSLVAGTANYDLNPLAATPFYQVFKVEKNVTGDAPKEIRIINQLEKSYRTDVGETEAEPTACYFIGDVIYFVPTPSTTTANYARVWLVMAEAATMATDGPAYIPVPAHRLIVYRAASLVATMLEANSTRFDNLYAQRLAAVRNVWIRRFRSQPRFVMPSIEERVAKSGRTSELFDRWFPE